MDLRLYCSTLEQPSRRRIGCRNRFFFRTSLESAAAYESLSLVEASAGTFSKGSLIAAAGRLLARMCSVGTLSSLMTQRCATGVMAVFLRQAQRLVDDAKGFPAVKKT